MSDNTVAKESQGVSRRDFLKLSAVAGGTAALFGSGIGAKEAQAKTYDTIDDMIQIDPAEFKRFKQSDVAFMRRMVPACLFKEDPADNPELMAKIFLLPWRSGLQPDRPGLRAWRQGNLRDDGFLGHRFWYGT